MKQMFHGSPQRNPSPLSELCSALPSLPSRLQQVGRFVAANDYDATTRSMRDLATVAGADPAAFTRLAKAIGYSGWDELRAALTEARRPAQSSPFSGRARGRRQGPNAEMSLVSDKLEAEAAGLARISPGAIASAAQGAARRAADLDRRFSQLPQRRGTAQLSASPVPPRHRATGRRLRPGGSRPRRVPRRRRRRRDRLCALFHGERLVGARGARRTRHADRDCGQASPRPWPRAPTICCSSRRPLRPGSFRASPAPSPSRNRWPRSRSCWAARPPSGASRKPRRGLPTTSQYVSEKG